MKPFLYRFLRDPIAYWWIFGLFMGGLFAWAGRYEMNPDGVNYTDMALEALQGKPGELINPLWSPGYPALLSLILGILQPDIHHEFPVIHLLNYLIFIFSLIGFTFFLKSLGLDHSSGSSKNNTPWFFYSLSFSVYFLFMLNWIGLKVVTPDILVSGIVFFTSGLILRLSNASRTWKSYILLGAAMGLGYYAKAPLFILGVALFFLLFFFAPQDLDRKKILVAFLVFGVTVLPCAIALTRYTGHWTIGESARLNYLWHVNKLDITTWMGPDHSGFGTPLHPPRVIMEKPLTLEMGYPIAGTRPLGYDPAYWYGGATPRFNMKQQLSAIEENLQPYHGFLSENPGLVVGGLLLFIFRFRGSPGFRIKSSEFCLIAWPLIAMGIYIFVHAENRYLAPFAILLWVMIYKELTERAKDSVKAVVFWGVVAFYFIGVPRIIHAQFQEAKAIDSPNYRPGNEVVWDEVHSLGIKPLDRIAVVGDAAACYFAHLGRLKIAVQVPDAEQFQGMSSRDFSILAYRLKTRGIKAIVVYGPCAEKTAEGWKQIEASAIPLNVFIL
jgi:hypothetical protein